MSAERVSHLALLVSFMIWVAYGVLAGTGRWPIAVAFGLGAASLVITLMTIRGHKVKLMDWTVLTYFVLAAAATFVVPLVAFQKYSSVIVWVLYGTGAWVSILVGKPFTLQYARESAAPERWQTPAFLRSNMVISMVWGLAFLANLIVVVVALDPRFSSLWLGVFLPILTLLAASVFTARYTRLLRAR